MGAKALIDKKNVSGASGIGLSDFFTTWRVVNVDQIVRDNGWVNVGGRISIYMAKRQRANINLSAPINNIRCTISPNFSDGNWAEQNFVGDSQADVEDGAPRITGEVTLNGEKRLVTFQFDIIRSSISCEIGDTAPSGNWEGEED